MATDPALSLFPTDKPPDEPIDEQPDGETPDKKPRVPKVAPAKVLPPRRPPLQKQFHILRSYVVASDGGKHPVSNPELAQVALMHTNNVSLANTFFADVGLIRREGGGYIPTAPVVEYHHQYDWEPDEAARKLAPLFADAWFGEIVLRSLALGPRPMKDVIRALGEAARATGDWRDSLEMLLGYLQTVGLVVVEGDTVRAAPKPEAVEAGDSAAETCKVSPEKVAAQSRSAPAPARRTQGSEDASANGIRFTINFDVSMQEMAGWTPDRIAAFFAGVAQVISAKQGGSTPT